MAPGRFWFGVALGGMLAAGAWVGHQRYLAQNDPCLGRCGAGTHCVSGLCAADQASEAPASPVKRRKRSRGGPGGEAPKIVLRPEDTRIVAEGDDLRRPTTRLDLTDTRPDRELEQEDIDRVFALEREAIAECLVIAVGEAPLERGRVTVSFRIEASGSVRGIRVEGPALLMRNGLGGCIRPHVQKLRFPPSGRSTVASYPFELK